MNILIVENTPIAMEMLRSALVRMGHRVESAGTSQAALMALSAHSFHLVIGSCGIPEFSGQALCQAVRADPAAPNSHIILMTSDDKTDIAECLAAGADDLMAKPFDPAELALRIRGAEKSAALQSRDCMLSSLARLADARKNNEDSQHLERVRRYGLILARGLAGRPELATEVTPAFIRNIYLASVLHDIGTMSIPDCILLKPGRLSDSEFTITKTHTTVGARTLQAAVDDMTDAAFARMAVDIALTHHERYDGQGYPDGLKGDKIPLCGRILALADVYDAVTSKRTYRSALDNTIARSIILEGSGTHFDPRIVDVFVRNESEFTAVRDKYADIRKEAA